MFSKCESVRDDKYWGNGKGRIGDNLQKVEFSVTHETNAKLCCYGIMECVGLWMRSTDFRSLGSW